MRFFFIVSLAAIALALAAASESEARHRGGRHGFRAGGHCGQRALFQRFRDRRGSRAGHCGPVAAEPALMPSKAPSGVPAKPVR